MLAQIEGSMDFLNLHNSQPDLVTFYIYEWNLLRISFFFLSFCFKHKCVPIFSAVMAVLFCIPFFPPLSFKNNAFHSVQKEKIF